MSKYSIGRLAPDAKTWRFEYSELDSDDYFQITNQAGDLSLENEYVYGVARVFDDYEREIITVCVNGKEFSS